MMRLLPLALLCAAFGLNCGGEAIVPGTPGNTGVCSPGTDSVLTALELTPTSVSLSPGARVQLSVKATYSDGCSIDATNAVYLTIGDSSLAKIGREKLGDGSSIRYVEGVAVGQTSLIASTQKGGAGFASAATSIDIADCSVASVPEGTPVVALTTFPSLIQIETGASTRVQAFATWTTGCVFDASDRIHFTVADTSVASMGVSTNASGESIHQITGQSVGKTTLIASLKANGEGLAASPVTVNVIAPGSGTLQPPGDNTDQPDQPDQPIDQPVDTPEPTLTLYPANLDMSPVDRMPIQVVLTKADGVTQDVTSLATIATGDSAIAKFVEVSLAVDKATRFVEAVAHGATTLSASYAVDGKTLTVSRPITVKKRATETRGIWVSRWNIGTSESAVRANIQKFAQHGFNAVFFQVMGDGTAYYDSKILPKKNASWDALAVAIDEARKQGVELHAYINALVGPTSVPSGHILEKHPEFICLDASGNAYPNDGYTWIAADDAYIEHYRLVVREIVQNYDVDGIHVDRIRSPSKDTCHSPALDALYATEKAAGRVSSWSEFYTGRVTKIMQAIYEEVVAHKPSALVSVAAWGIYKKFSGCGTSQGIDYNQDTVAWAEMGIVDALMPMTYWDFDAYGGCADWGRLADFFKANLHGRMLVMGMHATESNSPNHMYTDGKVHLDRITARIDYARSIDLAGTVIFASNYLSDADWDGILAGPYATDADPTPMVHR